MFQHIQDKAPASMAAYNVYTPEMSQFMQSFALVEHGTKQTHIPVILRSLTQHTFLSSTYQLIQVVTASSVAKEVRHHELMVYIVCT